LLESRLALASVPAGFADFSVASGLANPTAMALAPDGRIFVTQQTGEVRVIKNGAVLETPFLDQAVGEGSERGLLGIAFDPAFASNHFVYVYYTTPDSPVHNRVSRFTANGDVAAAGSETVLLDLNNLSGATNHNGGALHFGDDGKLYIAVGDNANGSNSQTLGNLLGKILRINATPGDVVPDDNPFVGVEGARGEIWALGLRNPFTFSVQPGTGRIFVNDVGQNTWEEVNNLVKGGNYGWPATEGPTSDPQFIPPVFAYQHDTGTPQGRAITGGAFYNPATHVFPSIYTGDYFFSDFGTGFIWRYDVASDTAREFATGLKFPVDLQVRPNGDLLYLERGTGSVRAIRYANQAPQVEIFAGRSYTEGEQPIPIAADAVVADPDSPQLGQGRLTVRTIANGSADDRFAIRAANGITTNGSTVLFNGQSIGVFSGGAGSPLIVALNNNASPAKVQALVRSVTFAVASQHPSTLTRTIDVRLSDGDGGLSPLETKQITVARVSDKPVIGGISGSVGYRQNSAPIALAAAATVADPDSANFAGGKLTLQVQPGGGSAANRLYLGGPFVSSGNQILLNGQAVGTRNAGGGQGFVKLEITLNFRATPAVVQQMLRAARFRTVNNDKLDPRIIHFTVSDGDGGASTATKTVNVTA
jgi:glucose/arabinose dehydrogenase